jgi:hypothetical protein
LSVSPKTWRPATDGGPASRLRLTALNLSVGHPNCWPRPFTSSNQRQGISGRTKRPFGRAAVADPCARAADDRADLIIQLIRNTLRSASKKDWDVLKQEARQIARVVTETRPLALFGDWHGDVGFAIDAIRSAAGANVRTMVHVGDLGLDWPGAFRGRFEARLTKHLAAKGITLVVSPGNHDNWDTSSSCLWRPTA